MFNSAYEGVARARAHWVLLAAMGCAASGGCAGSDEPVGQAGTTSTTGQGGFDGDGPDAGSGLPSDPSEQGPGQGQGQGGDPAVATGVIDAGESTTAAPDPDPGTDSAVDARDGGVGADGAVQGDAAVDAGPVVDPGPVVNAAGMPTSCPDPVLELSDPPFEVTSTPMLYDVDADTLPGIRQQMTARSPSSMAGEVAWYASWDFDWNACDGSGLVVGLGVDYILPRWTQPDPVAPEVVEGWAGYIDALWCHEYGHTQFGIDVVDETYRALAGLEGKVSGCSALRSEASRLFQEILQRYAEQEAAYDRDTNHGATMGARLPTDRN